MVRGQPPRARFSPIPRECFPVERKIPPLAAGSMYFTVCPSLARQRGHGSPRPARRREEGDPDSNKTNLRNPCPRKPYPGSLAGRWNTARFRTCATRGAGGSERSLSARITYFFDKVLSRFSRFEPDFLSCPRKTVTPHVYPLTAGASSLAERRAPVPPLLSSHPPFSFFILFLHWHAYKAT